MKNLVAQDFKNDERVIMAKAQIITALKDHQKQLTGIRPPQDERKLSYQDMLKKFENLRGGPLFIPYLGSGIGNGALVELADGSVKYDFIIGIGVHYFGHSHPELTSHILDAALADTVMQGNLQQNVESMELSQTLLTAAQAHGAKLTHCFLTSSGVMAGENALKIAFQKKTPASRVLCFYKCFMGRTITMAQTTDNPAYRVGLPKTLEVDYIPFFDENNPKESTAKAVQTLKDLLKKYPNQYAAMSFELVIGEGGFYVGDRDFFIALMTILKEHDIPIIVDEVQTFGRLPEIFGFQYFGLDEYVDVVWIGKASQVCATLFTNDMNPKPGLLSQTYTSSSSAITAGHYIVKHLLENQFYGPGGKINQLHKHFRTQLEALATKHPTLVSGPYGVGSMIAFTPFDGSVEKAKKLVNDLFENGVMCFVCGKEPTRIRFLLPVGAIDQSDIDKVLKIVEETLLQNQS